MTVANPTGAARDSGVRLKLPKQQRSMGIDAPTLDAESRTITFPFSSEMPVDRWFGSEVLSHRAEAVDLSRLNDGAPLLYNHDPGQLIGVIERAWVEDGRGYATARFSQNDLGKQVMRDVQDGIMRNVSVGYRILEMNSDGEGTDNNTFTATRWMPYEISAVSIPADNSVGIGRTEDGNNETEVSIPDAPVQEAAVSTPTPTREIKMSEINIDSERKEAAAAERSRISSITAWGEKFGQSDLARQLVESGRSITEAQSAFLEKLGAKQEPIEQSANLELNTKEQREYSIVRAINASMSGNWSEAGLERELSSEIERQTGRATSGFFMPNNLQMRAPYAVGASGTGGSLVATSLLAQSFIDVLRNNALIMSLGPTMLSGLVGNVSLPRATAATQTYWVAEASSITEAEATFDTVTLSPKQIGARSQYSRLALQQTTPDIEMVVRNDLAKVIALGIDLAAINGSGSSGQPTGILNTSGIGSVAMGTNGAALTNSSTSSTSGLDQLIDLESKLDTANALNGTLSYLTNAKVVAALKKLKSAYGEYLWTAADGVTTNGTPGAVNGYNVARSNQVPSNLTKGSGTGLSALVFGDFSSLLIGMWGPGVEILPNPYGSGYNAGSVDIRAMATVDIAVKHAQSFAAITDIIA
jgi:HK97 family phage major capsid protein/HK97 family phage prohead protease